MNRLIFDESDLIKTQKKAKIKNYKMVEVSSCYPNKSEFVHILNAEKVHEKELVKLETQKLFEKYLMQAVKKYVSPKNTILVVGLGNDKLSADSLGAKAVSRIFVSRGLELKRIKTPKVCAICPDIYAKTGIETFDIVSSIVDKIEPNLVIIIDSLATKSIKRLGTSFQITNTSIVPGGAMGTLNKELSSENLKKPCIIIGVPLILQIFENDNKIFLTPKDIEINVNNCAKIISNSINKVVHKTISEKELELLLT